MTVPNEELQPGDFSESEAARTSNGEVLASIDLFLSIVDYYQSAKEWNDQALDATRKLGRLANEMEARYYVMRGGNDAGVPCAYEQMLWRSANGHAAGAMVDAVYVRFPDMNSTMPAIREEASESPSDIFIEVLYTNQQSFRYLFNSKGIVPYKDGSDIGIVDYDHDSASVDAFRVMFAYDKAPALPSSLLKSILQHSEVVMQTAEES